MPAVPVAGPTATQNSPFLPQRWPKPSPILAAPAHGGMARLSGPDWPREYRDGVSPEVVTNPSTNRARRGLTLSM